MACESSSIKNGGDRKVNLRGKRHQGAEEMKDQLGHRRSVVSDSGDPHGSACPRLVHIFFRTAAVERGMARPSTDEASQTNLKRVSVLKACMNLPTMQDSGSNLEIRAGDTLEIGSGDTLEKRMRCHLDTRWR